MRKATFKESKKDYVIYHNSYTSAVEEIHRFAEKNGFQINPEESATKIGLNSVRPRDGETTRIFLQLYQEDGVTPAGRALHAQVYGMDNRYELNMYISPLKKRDYMWYEGTMKDNIIEIQEETTIDLGGEKVILEKGDRVRVLSESEGVLDKFKNYEDIFDENELNAKLLSYFGFIPSGVATDFGGSNIVGMIGSHQGRDSVASFIGGEKEYGNPEVISYEDMEKIFETLDVKGAKKVIFITNCGVPMHTQGYYADKIKVIKVPTLL